MNEKHEIIIPVMRKLNMKLKWMINDLGLNELDAWLCCAAAIFHLIPRNTARVSVKGLAPP